MTEYSIILTLLYIDYYLAVSAAAAERSTRRGELFIAAIAGAAAVALAAEGHADVTGADANAAQGETAERCGGASEKCFAAIA